MVEERDVGPVLYDAEAEGAEVLYLLLLDEGRARAVDCAVERLRRRNARLEGVDAARVSLYQKNSNSSGP